MTGICGRRQHRESAMKLIAAEMAERRTAGQ